MIIRKQDSVVATHSYSIPSDRLSNHQNIFDLSLVHLLTTTMSTATHTSEALTPPEFQFATIYPQRDDLHVRLHRLTKAAAFTCNRCKQGKKAKLVAFGSDSWDEPICNGCYGNMVSTLPK